MSDINEKERLFRRLYYFSSYGYYAFGKPDPLITPAPSYLALENTNEERQRVYQEMVGELVSKGYLNESNAGLAGNPDWVISQFNKIKRSVAP